MPLVTSFYLPRVSAVHRVHPRVKMLGLLALFVIVMTFNDPIYQAVIFIAILSLGAVSRISPFELLGRVRPVLLVGALIAAVWALFGPDGPVVWDFWIFHVTTTSIQYGIAAGLRVVSLALGFYLVLLTTQQADVLYGLISMRTPYPMAFIITSIFRFAPTIAGEADTIREAQRARAMRFDEGSLFVRIRKSISFVIPLMVRVLKTTVELSLAISSKAYGAGHRRTFFRSRAMKPSEFIAIFTIIAVAVASLALRFAGFGAVVPGTI
jgi:energy-coupling factor transport system permease protein